jgi:gas vesicle protein
MATKKVAKKKGVSAKTIIGVGAGVAVLGAAAYILFGPNGKKNQKAIKGWAVKMKGEIIEKFEEAKELTEPVYNKIIDEAKARYSKFQNVDKKELDLLAKDIKKHWKAIKRDHSKK